jgi:hypothetical protein
VHSVLNPPSGHFTCEIEPEPRLDVTDEIVNRPKAIECTSEPAIEQRMEAHSLCGRRCDLENPVGPHRRNEIPITGIRLATPGERDSNRVGLVGAEKNTKEAICLTLKLVVRGNHLGLV